MILDPETEFGRKVLRRLQEEQVIWLTTVAADGTPQPNPVWFQWDGATFLIYTKPSSKKVVNLRRNPRVALHFDATHTGEDVVVFTGTATFDEHAPTATQNPAYIAKYQIGIAALNSTPEQMSAEYNVRLRIKPDKLRGW